MKHELKKHEFKISKKRKEELANLLLDIKKQYGEPGDFQSAYNVICKRCEETDENGKIIPSEHEYYELHYPDEPYEDRRIVGGYCIPVAYKINSKNMHLKVEGDITQGGAFERLILYMVVCKDHIEYLTDYHMCLYSIDEKEKDGYYIYTINHGYLPYKEHKNIDSYWDYDNWVVCEENFREH